MFIYIYILRCDRGVTKIMRIKMQSKLFPKDNGIVKHYISNIYVTRSPITAMLKESNYNKKKKIY